jgi:hypothetical protein
MSSLEKYLLQTHGRASAKTYGYRRQGGSNNEKGNIYENEFAIYTAAKLYGMGDESKAVMITAQAEDFVDDMVCDDGVNSSRRNYQLKNSSSVRWGSGIADDFAIQQDINTNFHKRANSKTVLVVSDPKCQAKLGRKYPDFIAAHTECIYFKAEEFNSLLVANDPQVQPFKELCVYPDQTDKVTVVWQALAGSWQRNKTSPASVEKIIADAAAGYKPGYFKLPSSAVLSDNLVAKLDRISGLSYSCAHGFLTYVLQGCVSESIQIDSEELNQFEKVLSENDVTDWIGLINVVGRGDV